MENVLEKSFTATNMIFIITLTIKITTIKAPTTTTHRAGRQDKGGSLPGHAAMGKHKRHHSRYFRLQDNDDDDDFEHGDGV